MAAPPIESSSQDKMQRLFIGGLQPPLLTVDHILERFDASAIQNITFSSRRRDSRHSSYCHLDVPSHNLKEWLQWHHKVFRQCKLRVEVAQSSFLERLQVERQQQQQRRQQQESYPLPRHTRRHVHVRQFQTLHRIDTHPKRVTTWQDLGIVRRKKYKRAVHLRLGDTSNNNNNQEGVLPNEPSSSASTSASDPNDTDDDDSSSSSSRSALLENKDGIYQWSENSSSSSDDDENPRTTNHHSAMPPLTTQQPAPRLPTAAWDEFVMTNLDDENPTATESTVVHEEEEDSTTTLQVEAEVATNLQFLKDLFPDSIPTTTTTTMAPSSHEVGTTITPKLGWTRHPGAPIMIRYDPTLASSTQLERSPPNVDPKPAAPEDVEDMYTESLVESLVNHTTQEPPSIIENDVYEQAKLEQVFRQVRHEEGDEENGVGSSIDVAGGFAFGFALKEESTESPLAFSFSFPVTQPNTVTTGLDKVATNKASANDDDDRVQPPAPKKTRPAFFFPDEEIDARIHSYFRLNDGERILNDLEGYRNDPAVKAHWQQQRVALTHDWKRKRKLALARKQKK